MRQHNKVGKFELQSIRQRPNNRQIYLCFNKFLSPSDEEFDTRVTHYKKNIVQPISFDQTVGIW